MKTLSSLRKGRLGRALGWIVTVHMLAWQVVPVFALPMGESVTHGDVTFVRDASTLTVQQGSGRAIVNYSSFDIDVPEAVIFQQPGAGAAILNRVTGGGMSTIAGSLLANGNVFLINPNGILFSGSAQVNVGGLVASGLNMSDGDFLSGRLYFSGGGGSVINQGSLNGGFVYLIGGSVENQGSIGAGSVILGAGQTSVFLDEAAGGKIRLIIDGEGAGGAGESAGTAADPVAGASSDPAAEPAGGAPSAVLQQGVSSISPGSVLNAGVVKAEGDVGGTVLAQGLTVRQLGEVRADGGIGAGGQVELRAADQVVLGAGSLTTANAGLDGDGGTILVIGERSIFVDATARLEARGGLRSGNGGFIETSGRQGFHIGAAPDVSAPRGRAGAWLIDPYNIEIVPGFVTNNMNLTATYVSTNLPARIGAGVITNGLAAGNVTLLTGVGGAQPGNITNSAVLAYGSANALTLVASNHIVINAPITNTLAGALTFTAAGDVVVNADLALNGGSFASSGVNFTNNASILTGAGDIGLTHSGDIAQLSGVVSGNNVTLNAGGNVLAANLRAAAQLQVAAGGSIEESGNDAAPDLTADTLLLDAQTGIGAADAVEVRATTIGAQTVAGNLVLANTNGALTAASLDVTGGAGGVVFSQTGGGGLSVNVTTANGTIALTNSGANLRAMTLAAGGAGDVELATVGSGNVQVDDISAAGGQISIGSAGAIEEFNADTAPDLTAPVLFLDAQTGIGAAGTLELRATTIGAQTVAGNLILANTNNASTSVDLGTGVGAIAYSQTGGAAVGINAITANGAIAITNSGANLAAGTVSAGGATDVTLVTLGSGGVAVDDVAAGGRITIVSAGVIAESAGGDPGADLTANDLQLRAQGGIGALGAIETQAATLTLTNTAGGVALSAIGALVLDSVLAGNGPITISAGGLLTATAVRSGTDAAANDIRLTGDSIVAGTIRAGTRGDVRLDAGAGAITDAASDIRGTNIVLLAGAGIGAASPIAVMSRNITASNTGAQTMSLVNAYTSTSRIDAIYNLGHVIYTQQTGSIYVDGTIQTTNGSIVLAAPAGNINVRDNQALIEILPGGGPNGNVYLSGDVSVKWNKLDPSPSETITLAGAADGPLQISDLLVTTGYTNYYANDILLDGEIAVSNNSSVLFIADSDADGQGGLWLQGSGFIGGDGNLSLGGSSLLEPGGQGNSVRISGPISMSSNVTLMSNAAAPAGAGIVVLAPITSSVGRIDILAGGAFTNQTDLSSASGDIYIRGSKLFIDGPIDPLTVTLESAGDMTINAGVTATLFVLARAGTNGTGNLTITPAGSLTSTLVAAGTGASGGSLTNAGTVAAVGSAAFSAPAGDIELSGTTTVTTGDAYVAAPAGSVSMTGGALIQAGDDILLGANGGVALGRLIGDAVGVVSLLGAITDGNGATDNATASALVLQAASGIGTGADRLETTATTLAGQTGTGGIYLDNSGATTVGSAGVGVNILLPNGSLAAANLPLVSGLTADRVKLTAGGQLDVNQPVVADVDDVLLRTTAGDVVVSATVTAARHASLRAGAGVQVLQNVAATAGDAYIEAAAGAVTMGAGTQISAGDDLFVDATGNVALGLLSGDAVGVRSSGGAISDANAAANNVAASSLALQAGTGIGVALDSLETDVALLAAQTTAGGVHIGEATTLTVGTAGASVSYANADSTLGTATLADIAGLSADRVDLAAGNTLTVTNAVAAAVDNVLLTAAAGNLQLDAGVTAVNTIQLAAPGGSIQGSGMMTAPTLTANAGAAIALDTTVDTLSAATTAGGITIAEANGLTLQNLAAGGAGSDVAVTSATGNIVVGDVTAGDEVHLTATAGSIVDDANNLTDINALMATLTAGNGSIGAAGNEIDTTVNTLVASATGGGVYVIEADGMDVPSAAATGAGNSIVIASTAGTLTGGVMNAAGLIDLTGPALVLTSNLTGVGVTLTGPATLIGPAQRIDATTGVLLANNTVTKTSAGLLTLAGDTGINLMALVDVQAGDLLVEDAVDANANVQAGSGSALFLNGGAFAGDVMGQTGVGFGGAATFDGGVLQTVNAGAGALAATGTLTKTTAGDLALASAGGGLDVDGNIAVHLGTVQLGDALTLTGNIVVRDDLDLNQPITLSGAGDQTLMSVLNDVLVNSTVTKSIAGSGDLRIEAGDVVTFLYQGGGSYRLNSNGNDIRVGAVNGITVRRHGLNTAPGSGGSIDISGGNILVSGSQHLGAGDVFLTTLISPFDVVLDNTELPASNIDAQRDIILLNGTRVIADGNLEVLADSDSAINNDASGSGYGGVYVDATSRIEADGANEDIIIRGAKLVRADLGANIANAIQIEGTVDGAEDILLQDNGNAAVTADISIGAAGLINAPNGHVSIRSDQNIFQAPGGAVSAPTGSVFIDAAGAYRVVGGVPAGINLAGARVVIQAGGDVDLGSITGATVSVQANGDILDADQGPLNIAASRVRLVADADGNLLGRIGGASILSPPGQNPNAINIDAGTVAARGADGIYIEETDGVTIGRVNAFDVQVVQPPNGNVSDQNIPALSDVETTAGGPIKVVTMNGDLTVTDGDADGVGVAVAGGAGNVLLEARGAGSDVDMSASVLSPAGAIHLRAAQDVNLDLVTALQVNIEAGRDITDNNDAAINTPNVTGATDLRMVADADADQVGMIGGPDTGNGTPDENENAIDVDVTRVAARAADGIYLRAPNALTVDQATVQQVNFNSLDVAATLADLETTDNGPIKAVAANGALTVNDGDADTLGVVAHGTGDVLLQSPAGDVAVNALVQSGTGNIRLDAGVNLLFGAGGGVSTLGSILLGTGGDITLPAAGLVAGSLGIEAGGNILDGNGAALDIQAGQLWLEAGGRIGSPDALNLTPDLNANAIRIDADTLAARAASGIYILDDDGVTVGQTDVARVYFNSTSDSFGMNDVRTTAGGPIKLVAANGDLVVMDGDADGEGVVVAGGAGNVLLDARGAGSDVDLGASVLNPLGAIHLRAAQDVNLDLVTALQVNIEAGRDILDNNDGATINTLNVTGATDLRMVADTDANLDGRIGGADAGNGTPDANANAIDVEATRVAARSADGIYLWAPNALTVDQTTVRQVNFNSTDAAVSLADLETTDNGPIKAVAAAGHLTVNDGDADLMGVLATGTAADVLLRARGGGHDVLLNAGVRAGRHLTIRAADAIDQAGNVSALTGTIDAEATAGAITMAAGVNSAASGNIRYLADGNVVLGLLSGNQIRVQSDNGSILGNGAAMNAWSGDLQLSAANGGVGQPTGTGNGPIKTWVGNLAVESQGGQYLTQTGAGNVTVDQIAFTGVNRVNFNSTLAGIDPATLSDLVAAAGPVKLETLNGSITVNDGNADGAGVRAQGAGSDVLLRAQGAGSGLTLNADVEASRNASLIAAGAIAQSADVAAGSGSIDVEAAGGGIAMGAGVESVAGGNIRYLASGNVLLGFLDGAQVQVQSTGGSILGNGAALNVQASDLHLSAVGGGIGEAVGSGNGPLRTRVSNVTSLSQGNQYLTEVAAGGGVTVDQMTFGGVDRVNMNSTAVGTGPVTQSDLVATAGAVKLLAEDGTITVNEGDADDLGIAAQGAAGDVLLLAQGAGSDIEFNADVEAGRTVTLLAADAVRQNADVAAAAGSIDVEATAGGIAMAGGASAAAPGNIRYLADGDIVLGLLAGAQARVESQNGSIRGNGAAVNVQAADLQLSAANGSLGQAAGTGNGPLRMQVNTMAAQSQGNQYLTEVAAGGGVAVDQVTFGGVNRVNMNSTTAGTGPVTLSDLLATDGSVKLQAENGTITVNEGDADDVGVRAQGAAGDVLLLAQGAGSDLALNADVEAGRHVTLLAADAIGQMADVETAGGAIDAEATAGALTMGAAAQSATAGGDIRYLAQADVTVGRLDAGAGLVGVQSIAGSILDAQNDLVGHDAAGFATGAQTVNLAGSGAQMRAGAAVGAAGNPLDTAVGVLAAAAPNGSVYVYEDNGAAIADVGVVGVQRVGMNSGLAPVGLASLAGVAVNTHAKVETRTGNLAVNNGVTSAAGDVQLAAAAGDVTVGAAVAAQNNVTVLAQGNVAQNADVTAAAGTLDVEAVTGSIVMNAGTEGRAAGNVRYAAGQDIALNVLRSTGGLVGARAANGNITDVNGDAINVIANSGMQLRAGGAIGAIGDRIEVETALEAATAANGLYLTNMGDIVIGTVPAVQANRVHLDSTTGTVQLDALTGLTVTNDGSIVQTAPNIIVSNDVVATGGSTNICLLADDHVLIYANVQTVSNGAIAIWADKDGNLAGNITQSNGVIETVGGNIYMAGYDITQQASGVITSTAGTAVLSASNNLSLAGTVNAYNLVLGAAAMTINGNLSAPGTAILRAHSGSIVGSGRVAGGSVGLSAHLDIGTVLDRFNTEAGILAAGTDPGFGGDIYLQEETGAAVGTVATPIGYFDGVPVCAAGIPMSPPFSISNIISADNIDIRFGGTVTGGAGAEIRAPGNILLFVGGAVSTLGNLQAGGNITMDTGAYGGNTLLAGGNWDADIGGSLTLDTADVGRVNDLLVSGDARVTSFRVGGDIVLADIGGTFGEGALLDVGGGINQLNVGGDFVYETVNVGDAAQMDVGGAGEFNEMTIGDKLTATFGGNFKAQTLKTGPLDLKARAIDIRRGEVRGAAKLKGSSWKSNDFRARTLRGEFGGGSVQVVNLDVNQIDLLRGGLIDVGSRRTAPIYVERIQGGDVTLKIPGSGLLSAHDNTDTKSNYNIIANKLTVQAQFVGRRGNPMSIDVAGKLDFKSPGGEPMAPGFLWLHGVGDLNSSMVEYDVPPYGLLIFNSQVIGGDEGIMREIQRTEAFAVETPELKSRQGVFGSPYFLHSYLQISEPVALGIVDYILYGQASITADPVQMPREAKRLISFGDPTAATESVRPSYWQLPLKEKK